MRKLKSPAICVVGGQRMTGLGMKAFYSAVIR